MSNGRYFLRDKKGSSLNNLTQILLWQIPRDIGTADSRRHTGWDLTEDSTWVRSESRADDSVLSPHRAVWIICYDSSCWIKMFFLFAEWLSADGIFNFFSGLFFSYLSNECTELMEALKYCYKFEICAMWSLIQIMWTCYFALKNSNSDNENSCYGKKIKKKRRKTIFLLYLENW